MDRREAMQKGAVSKDTVSPSSAQTHFLTYDFYSMIDWCCTYPTLFIDVFDLENADCVVT